MEHIVSYNIRYDYQLNGVVENELKFDSTSILYIQIMDPQTVVTFDLKRGKYFQNGLFCWINMPVW